MISAQVYSVSCPKAHLINAHKIKGLQPLPPAPLGFVHCSSLKFRANIKIATNALKSKQRMPVCMAEGGVSAGNENQDPLWKSFGKAIGNLGKKPSLEDVLRQQIEKGEYYEEDGNSPGGRGGGSGGGGGGGFGDLGGYEEDGFSEVLEETMQVILATLGFIFLYMYIINGAEMTRLAKDYIKFLLGGKKSIRLTRAFYHWERFWMRFKPKKRDPKWLERAIITTPTWWDSPEKYRRILRSYLQNKARQSKAKKYEHE